MIKKIRRLLYVKFFFDLNHIECGLTRRMPNDFEVSKKTKEMHSPAKMHCTDDKECHCYGKICLVSDNKKGNCSAGNVFVNGRAFCGGANGAWTLEFGRIICRELGFSNIVRVTDTRNIRE